MVLGQITNSLINGIIQEARKDENQERLRCYVLNPMAAYIEDYLKPYFFTLLIVLLVMVGLLLWVLRVTMRLANRVGVPDT
jgi:hypothetical protein